MAGRRLDAMLDLLNTIKTKGADRKRLAAAIARSAGVSVRVGSSYIDDLVAYKWVKVEYGVVKITPEGTKRLGDALADPKIKPAPAKAKKNTRLD